MFVSDMCVIVHQSIVFVNSYGTQSISIKHLTLHWNQILCHLLSKCYNNFLT